MLTLDATIYNDRDGRLQWYGFLTDASHFMHETPRRSVYLGRLDPQSGYADLRSARRGIDRVCRHLKAELVALDWSVREYDERGCYSVAEIRELI